MRHRGASGRVRAVCLAVAACLAAWIAPACGQNAAPSPFDGVGDAGSGGALPDAGLPPLDAGPDPTLGGPCLDDGQCDDGIDCTTDGCDLELERCRFSPDDGVCADDVFCDGLEVCELGLGCREGTPLSCSDSTACTIDVCVESTRSCEHAPRDADGDGDPVWNCGTGDDCDDSNPRVNGATVEVCGNGRDDDCDLEVDELDDCSEPVHDTCGDALVVEGSGSYSVSLSAAKEDEPLSCAPSDPARRDVIVAIVVPEGDPVDVDVAVRSDGDGVAVGAIADCDPGRAELACHPGVPLDGGSVARVVLRALAPGAHPVVVSATSDLDAVVEVRYGPALPAPANLTCGTVVNLARGVNQRVSLAGVAADLGEECGEGGEDVVYRFDLTAPQDVEVRAVSLDGYGAPSVSLRGRLCDSESLWCRSGEPATLFARALPIGRYFVILGATGPTDVDLRFDVFPPSEAPPGEGCLAAPSIASGDVVEVELGRRVDAVRSPCASGASDASFTLDVAAPSDLLLVERISMNDRGAVSLFAAECSEDANLVCETSRSSPVRARALGVAPGAYHVVAESEQGAPITVSVLSRPARPATLVAFAEGCEDAVRVPSTGGRFVGNTANAEPDYPASCDFGASSGGAPDQMLRLELDEDRRVVLDMAESDYDTLLVVRRGDACPGSELDDACAPGYVTGRSYLDLTLRAGEYFVQIDGYEGDFGAWVLDVFFAEP